MKSFVEKVTDKQTQKKLKIKINKTKETNEINNLKLINVDGKKEIFECNQHNDLKNFSSLGHLYRHIQCQHDQFQCNICHKILKLEVKDKHFEEEHVDREQNLYCEGEKKSKKKNSESSKIKSKKKAQSKLKSKSKKKNSEKKISDSKSNKKKKSDKSDKSYKSDKSVKRVLRSQTSNKKPVVVVYA